MKLKSIVLFVLFCCFQSAVFAERIIIPMDKDWKFQLGDLKEAVNPSFDDASWRSLNIPHDWSIEGRYNKYNKTGRGGGYLPAGDGWYRKSFSLPASESAKKVFIEFDGIMANSEVYINGQLLGKWPYGYTTLHYDMSEYLLFGEQEKNVLTVRANNVDQPASRWYAGAGIYRHARMIIKDPVHIANWGVFVTTPDVSPSKATVKATIQLDNTSNQQKTVSVQSSVIDKNDKVIQTRTKSQRIAANSSANIEQSFAISNPLLWDLEDPNMYRLETKVSVGKVVVDNQSTPFGIRSIRYDAAKGFFLNDKSVKMYGACMHHDGGGVGAAVPLGVWEYRFNKLKEAGINAIRTSHNPMAPEFYDLCDKMGLLVMNENFDTWEYKKNPYDYNQYFNEWWEKDTRAMVMRDRNHPSIVLYSVGNEIRDNLNNEAGFKKYKQQQDLIHELDPTRPVTMALFRPNTSNVYNNGFADMMDVVGQNYRPQELLDAHAQNPKRIVIGTENVHDLETYLALRDHEFMCGQFLWVGFDYLGEAQWPKISFQNGLFDKAGDWKRNGLLRKSWWSEVPTVSVVRRYDNAGRGEWVHDWTPWDPIAYEEAYLEIYSNTEEVELFLNNQSVGKFKVDKNRKPIQTNINYWKGELRAEGRINGKTVTTDVLKTAGEPHKIVLSAHKASIANNGEDVSYVRATIVDKDGVQCPDAEHLVEFKVSGAGYLLATENGSITNHESSKTNERSAHEGACYAIVQANQDAGTIKITAQTEWLEGVASMEVIVK